MTAAHFLSWLQSTAIVCGSLGLVLAFVAIARDGNNSRALLAAEIVLVTLIGAWFAFTGGVALFAQDLTCACDACKGIDPYTLLWYLQGCWF